MKLKLLASILMLFSLTTFAVGGGGKLLDLLVNESGLIELLTRNGIEAAAARQVQHNIANSLTSLGLTGQSASPEALQRVIAGLGTSREDRKIKTSLLKLLNQDAEVLKKGEMVEAINNLIYLANRHGVRGSLVLACSECVNESLFIHGFKFSMEEVSRPAVKKLFESNIIPNEPRELSRFIASKMKRLNVGDYSKTSSKLVAPEREKSLAIFLALAEKNSPATKVERDFIDAVLAISTTPSGQVKLLNESNPHSLWSTFAINGADEEYLTGMTALLKETAERGKDNVSKKDAFFEVLDDTIGSTSKEAQDGVNSLRIQTCFFGK